VGLESFWERASRMHNPWFLVGDDDNDVVVGDVRITKRKAMWGCVVWQTSRRG
jgi:hypothetical protein